jgi:Flp pilus assembly pilin Flp
MKSGWVFLLKGKDGQGMTEYILIIGLIAIIMMATLQMFEQGVSGTYQNTVAMF